MDREIEHFALHGPNLTLRLPQTADAAPLYRLASDPRVTQWFSWGPYRQQSDAAAYLGRLPEQRERGTQLDLVQEHRELGVVGITGLSEFSYRDRRAMVGSWLGYDAWGTGINTESKALVGYLAFAVLGLARIGAYANPENGRSQTALEKTGFVREGVLRGWHRHGDRQLDVAVYGMLAAEWRASPAAQLPVRCEGSVPRSFTDLLIGTQRAAAARS